MIQVAYLQEDLCQTEGKTLWSESQIIQDQNSKQYIFMINCVLGADRKVRLYNGTNK